MIHNRVLPLTIAKGIYGQVKVHYHDHDDGTCDCNEYLIGQIKNAPSF